MTGVLRAIWGEADAPEDPILLHLHPHVGGLIAGAVDARGQVWAYLLGVPTARADTQHPHRLGVHPSCRRRGLGERLKRFQRAWCLERGVTRVRWTFDPLLLANALLNVRRLGAVVTTSLPNHCGEVGGLNAGVPSDRSEVKWRLDSAWAGAHLKGHAGGALDPLNDALPDAPAVRLPRDHSRLLREEPGQALEWRRCTGPLFCRRLGAGSLLVDVDLGRQQYLFQRGSTC